MLITNKGYTKSALRRAFYGPSELELDILDFATLQRFQGFAAIPYSGDHAILISAPFGWVIDISHRQDWLAVIYRRGLDLETAKKQKEFLYINFWDKAKNRISLAELDEQQVASMRISGPVVVSYKDAVCRPDAVTLLRIADVKKYGCLEITGFLEFETVIVFAVLLTPRETQRSNIRRLESILRRAIPVSLERDNIVLITRIHEQLSQTPNPIERANLLRSLGHWYRDMGRFGEARSPLETSLELDPTQAYATIRELLPVVVRLGDRDRAMELTRLLLRLDPRNPTVFNDAFTFASGWLERSDLLDLIDHLKAETPDDPLVQANCDYYAGLLLVYDNRSAARKRFLSAKEQFRRLFTPEHPVFRSLRVALNQCS